MAEILSWTVVQYTSLEISTDSDTILPGGVVMGVRIRGVVCQLGERETGMAGDEAPTRGRRRTARFRDGARDMQRRRQGRPRYMPSIFDGFKGRYGRWGRVNTRASRAQSIEMVGVRGEESVMRKVHFDVTTLYTGETETRAR